MWSKVNSKTDFKLKDQLYVEYSFDGFNGLTVNENTEPELYTFVNDIRNNGPRFYSYTPEQLEHFASRIYELRKNNLNNPT